MSSILIVGGSGFFGKSLLRRLSHPNFSSFKSKISVLSRNPDTFVLNNKNLVDGLDINFFQGDIMNPDSLPHGCSFTHIIHAATDSTIGPKLPPIYRYDQIVQGTRNVLELALSTGARRFLLTSSGGVYGPQPPQFDRIPEDYCGMPDPLLPSQSYGVGKRTAEHLCALYADQFDLECVIARCFAFVGPDLPLDAHFAIGNFLRDALYSEQIVVQGSGLPIRSYLHQDDLADWLLSILFNGISGCAYNLGSDEPISIRDLAFLIRDLVSPNKQIVIRGIDDVLNVKNIYVPNIDRAKYELGLSVSLSLRDAILSTAKSILIDSEFGE